MNAIGLFGAFATLFAAGYGLLVLLIHRSVRLSLAEQIAFSWLFGTGAVSLLLWVFGFFAAGLLLQGLVSVVCISLGMVGWKLRNLCPGSSVARAAFQDRLGNSRAVQFPGKLDLVW